MPVELFGAEELAAMRATLNATLPETITVRRATKARDSAGGATTTWATHATVAARVSPTGTQADEQQIGEQLDGRQRWTVTVPAGSDVTAADQIHWGTRVFEVVGVNATRSYELVVRISAVEIR